MDAAHHPITGLRRFSSRLTRLDHTFLRERLTGTIAYDRIAGYFRSSIFEVAAKELRKGDENPVVRLASPSPPTTFEIPRLWPWRRVCD